MRSPGAAVRRAVERRLAGVPWFESAGESFGDAGLARAVAVGAVHAVDPAAVGLAASLDAVVSHASRRAVASSVALAGTVATLVSRPDDADPWALVGRVVESLDHRTVRSLLQAALARDGATDGWDDDIPPHAPDVLAAALRLTSAAADPVEALVAAVMHGGGERTVVALTGALAGAVHGLGALPARWSDVEGAAAYRELARRIAARPNAGATTGRSPNVDTAGADIWFLLDRSGSMQSIAGDVVDGFECFFTEQRGVGGEATVTVVQFDDQDPHDVVVDARPIADCALDPRSVPAPWVHAAVRRRRPPARPRRAARRGWCRPARRHHDRRDGERQPALGPALAVPAHRWSA